MIKEAYVDRKNEFIDRSVGQIWQTVQYQDGNSFSLTTNKEPFAERNKLYVDLLKA